MSDIRKTKKQSSTHTFFFEILVLAGRKGIHEVSICVVWKYSIMEYTGT